MGNFAILCKDRTIDPFPSDPFSMEEIGRATHLGSVSVRETILKGTKILCTVGPRHGALAVNFPLVVGTHVFRAICIKSNTHPLLDSVYPFALVLCSIGIDHPPKAVLAPSQGDGTVINATIVQLNCVDSGTRGRGTTSTWRRTSEGKGRGSELGRQIFQLCRGVW